MRLPHTYLTATGSLLLLDEWGNHWEYINAYFGARLACGRCGCTDFAGWRCLEDDDLRCNDCVIVRRPQGGA